MQEFIQYNAADSGRLSCRVQLVYKDSGGHDGDSFQVNTIARDGYDCVEEPLVKAIVEQHSQHRDHKTAAVADVVE